jgi:cobalt-zinc-cadmium efflux system protein
MAHNHDHSHSDDHAPGGFRLLMVIIFNLIITIAEYIGGIISGSLALLSDAGHNFSDVLSLMLGYAGEKVSEKKGSTEYTFGLKRFEVVVALVNATALIGIGIYILYEAIMRYLNPVDVDISIMLPIACVGLGGNLLSIIFLFKSKDKNLNMKAAFLHLLYDTLSSVAVIIAAIVIYFTGILAIDIFISGIIVLMIFWSSLEILKDSMRIFMQGAPSHIDIDEVKKVILSNEEIEEVHGLHIWSVNSNEIFLSCHICLKENYKDTDTDSIIHIINHSLSQEFHIEHTALQIETTKLCNSDETCCR